MKRAVIFDFDGTIVNSFSMIAEVYNRLASEYGARTIAESELESLRACSYKEVFATLGIGMGTLVRLAMRIQKDMQQQSDQIRPISGMPALLRALVQEGFVVGVVTSNRVRLVEERLHAYGCLDAVSFIVSVKRLRPKGKALKRVMRKYKLDPARTTFVGDETRDVEAAHHANIASVAVLWGFQSQDRLVTSKPTHVVDSVEALRTYLFDL